MPSLDLSPLWRGTLSRRLIMRAALGALLLLPVGAGSLALAGERVVVGQTFLAPGLDPAKGSAGWALVSHGIAENLFTVGRDGRVTPLLAEKAVRTNDTTWEITLKAGRRFSDGSEVTAAKVSEALNRTGAENPQARASVGRITFEASGPLSLRAVSEKPSPVMPSVLAEWAFPVYTMTDKGPLFTGPWQVTSFEADKQIVMAANPSYPDAATRPDILLRKFSNGQSLALAVQSGEVDLGFNLPSEALPQLARTPGVTVKSFPVSYQYMAWMNTSRPALSDVRVRRALDLAIDRNLLAQAINGGKPATGAFAADYPFASTAPRLFDAQKAAALLDEAGWRLDGGVRKKDGQALALDVLAYPQRPDLVTFLPVLKSELAKLGIEARTRVADNISGPVKEGSFDLALWAQHTAPAGDPAFFLNLFLRSGGANNFARYSSPKLDAVLDRFATVTDPAERAKLARDAEAIVFADAPVSYLLTPVWHVGLSKRLASYEPWGSDYYVLRPDLKAAP